MSGVLNSPVTQKGKDQIKALKHKFRLREFDYSIVSPSFRALETSTAILAKNIRISENVREMNGGIWEGMNHEQLAKEPSYLHFCSDIETACPPKGESVVSIRGRLKTTKRFIVDNKDKDIVIVSHGVLLRVLISELLNISMRDIAWLNNTAYTQIKYENNKFEMIKHNVSDHLSDLLVSDSEKRWEEKFNTST